MANLEDAAPDTIAAAVSKAVVDAVAGGGSPEAIVARALEDARRALGLGGPELPDRRTEPTTPSIRPRMPHAVITEDDVLDAARNGNELRVGRGTLVTPLARDTAKDRGVRLVED